MSLSGPDVPGGQADVALEVLADAEQLRLPPQGMLALSISLVGNPHSLGRWAVEGRFAGRAPTHRGQATAPMPLGSWFA